ncbi:MAG: hypothetical protein IPK97_02565 [Ahniella sp.]|nr:hypothetical protein [Ahniella sp.]
MSTPANTALSVVSCQWSSSNTSYAMIGIGNTILNQQAPTNSPSFWFVVIARTNLNVVYNALQTAPDQVPPISQYNDSNHILVVATLSIGLNNQPQGALFAFLDVNGAGAQLRRIEQLAVQFNCGSLGTYGYALVGVLGNGNIPGSKRARLQARSWVRSSPCS